MRFIRLFDELFDVLNSRNPFGKGTKAAMYANNKDIWNPFFEKARNYILNLKTLELKPLYETKRKTGFIGFLIAIKSFQGIFEDLIDSSDYPMKYLLTYKFSQDHLELFFSAIRACGGRNDNPSVRQFISAYKRLLLRSSVQGGQGNVICRDNTSILHLMRNADAKNGTSILHPMSDTYVVDRKILTISEATNIRKYGVPEDSPASITEINTSEINVPDVAHLSEYKTEVISYIAGYVVKMVVKQISCIDCCESLGSKGHIH